ncbi:MAG: hypothetical protein ACK5Z5_06820 [Neisseriaceae bacterium]
MLKTNTGKTIAVTELTWHKLIDTITPTNPDLANAMKKVGNNGINYIFYKAKYRFGDKIINNGKCYLPLSDGGTIAFDDPELPKTLRNDLSYNISTDEDPLGLILTKSSEFYLPGNDGIHSHSIMRPGNIFGIPKAVDDIVNDTSTSVLELNLNAGARSLFMLTKISDKTHHVRLQRHYGINTSTPSSYQDHWGVFLEIANKANSSWSCEIIYFPRNWINQLKDDDWVLLTKKLMAIHRASYNIGHRVSRAWNKAFGEMEQEKKLNNYQPYPLTTAKKLFMLAANMFPGFKPAINDDSAPISLLTQAYTEIYNKREEEQNSAVIMEPSRFSVDDGNPIYYSINYSPLSQYHLESANKKSHIGLLEDIRKIIEAYSNAILDTKSNVPVLYDIVKSTSFSFYHSSPENYPRINNARQIPNEDTRFVENRYGEFPYSSAFFRGCIKISRI